jgi:ATP-dependent RNA helicase DeaD
VGAIANEGGLDAKDIGRVAIKDRFSLIDLPKALDTGVIDHLKRVKVAGTALNIRPDRTQFDSSAPKGSYKGRRADFSSAGSAPTPRRAKPKSASKSRTGAQPHATSPEDRRPKRSAKPVSRAQRKAGHQRRQSAGSAIKRGRK